MRNVTPNEHEVKKDDETVTAMLAIGKPPFLLWEVNVEPSTENNLQK